MLNVFMIMPAKELQILIEEFNLLKTIIWIIESQMLRVLR